MPTRNGIATGICGVLCLIAGRTFGIFELYIVAAALLALVAAAIAWVLINWRSLEATRQVDPPRLHAGGSSVVTLALANRRWLPTPVAHITDEVGGEPRADAHVPPLSRDRITRASYGLPTHVRGRIPIGPMRTRVSDPFALAAAQRTSAPDTSLLVLPSYDRIVAPPKPSGNLAARPDRTAGRIGPNGEEFSSLRAYVMGDDLRKVHWPSTARSGELVVRNEHIPEHGDSLVALDVRARAADPATFERMVSAATSVLVACFERGDTVRLVTTAGYSAVADGGASFDRVLDFLALVQQVPTDTIEPPAESSGAATDSAVLIVGSSDVAHEAFVANSIHTSTYVLRFVEGGARSPGAEPALRSRRVAVIGSRDELPPIWSALIGPNQR